MPEDNAPNAGQIENIFGSIREDYNPPVMEEGDENPEMLVTIPGEQNTSDGETKPQDEGDGRYQYWQSQADKMRAELAARDQFIQQYAPIIQLVNNNPEALSELQQKMTGGQRQEQPLVPPVSPQRPEGYTDYEAYNDPESASYRYRAEREDYSVKLAEYLVQKDMIREQEFEKQRQTYMAEQQNKAKLNETYGMLSNQYGMSQAEALDFVQTFADEKSITMDNLVQLYRISKGSVPNPAINQQRKWSPPPPVAQNTVQQTKQGLSEEQRFNASLNTYSWKNQKQ